MSEFFRKLLRTEDFMPRWQCGSWSDFHGWLHIVSDLLIFGAYLSIPLALAILWQRRRRDLPRPGLIVLFGSFIVACGITHAVEASIFYWPAYRLSGLLKAITAVVSWATVIALLRVVPELLELRTPAELEREIEGRTEALNASEAQLRAMFDQAAVGMVRVDLDGTIADGNARLAELSGRPQQDLPGLALRELIGGELTEAGADPASAPRAQERELRRPDGGSVWVQLTPSLVRDEAGQATALLLIVEDISERKQVRAQLLRERQELETRVEQRTRELALRERSYRAVFESEAAGIAMLDEQEQITQANGALAAMSGRPVDALLGRPLTELLHPEDRPAAAAAVRGDLRLQLEQGERWVAASSSALESGSAVFLVDIDDQKRLEATLAQAQKMEAVGRLAGGIAHDFNNMLVVILGNAELMQETDSPDERRQSIEDIISVCDRLVELTNQLLTFSRKRELNPRVLSLTELLGRVDRLLTRVLGEDIELRLKPLERTIHIRFDRTQLEQTLVNMAVNARDAMPDGGELVIGLRVLELDESEGPLQALAAGSYACVTVSDSGHGMDAATRDRVFEPFFTTKGAGGTGLGLATAYGLVQSMGGVITVYSEPGIGTTFQIVLPIVEQEADASGEHRAQQAVTGGDERVLLVEDEPAVLAIGERLLRSAGYDVVSATSGADALERLDESIQLLLTDVVMPGITGPELAERSRQRFPGLRVLMTSGYAVEVFEARGVAPSDSLVSKPFTRAALLRAVRSALDDTPPAGGSQ